MKIGTLNIGHQTLRPRVIPEDLLDVLVALDLDLLFLTEYVNTDDYAAALNRRWPHVLNSAQAPYRSSRSHNQVVALSRLPLRARAGHQPVPTEAARTNFLSVEVAGLIVTGMRAPAYKPRDWYAYWDALAQRLDGDVVIGDFNVDPSRRRRRDQVLPMGWRLVTPAHGPSYRSLRNGSESAIDHALVRHVVELRGEAIYDPKFFGRWGLDHCPLVIDVRGENSGASTD
ncbi:MAG TPA: endonuclease/exonuclease/phosphatase family protein [Enhygromyxa sp.]|nr:endonuclease/exonuclease/phosphatase family protein [Enhygromyxa sp.]